MKITVFDNRLAELQEGNVVPEWVGRVVLRVEDDLGDLDILRRIRATRLVRKTIRICAQAMFTDANGSSVKMKNN